MSHLIVVLGFVVCAYYFATMFRVNKGIDISGETQNEIGRFKCLITLNYGETNGYCDEIAIIYVLNNVFILKIENEYNQVYALTFNEKKDIEIRKGYATGYIQNMTLLDRKLVLDVIIPYFRYFGSSLKYDLIAEIFDVSDDLIKKINNLKVNT